MRTKLELKHKSLAIDCLFNTVCRLKQRKHQSLELLYISEGYPLLTGGYIRWCDLKSKGFTTWALSIRSWSMVTDDISNVYQIYFLSGVFVSHLLKLRCRGWDVELAYSHNMSFVTKVVRGGLVPFRFSTHATSDTPCESRLRFALWGAIPFFLWLCLSYRVSHDQIILWTVVKGPNHLKYHGIILVIFTPQTH